MSQASAPEKQEVAWYLAGGIRKEECTCATTNRRSGCSGWEVGALLGCLMLPVRKGTLHLCIVRLLQAHMHSARMTKRNAAAHYGSCLAGSRRHML